MENPVSEPEVHNIQNNKIDGSACLKDEEELLSEKSQCIHTQVVGSNSSCEEHENDCHNENETECGFGSCTSVSNVLADKRESERSLSGFEESVCDKNIQLCTGEVSETKNSNEHHAEKAGTEYLCVDIAKHKYSSSSDSLSYSDNNCMKQNRFLAKPPYDFSDTDSLSYSESESYTINSAVPTTTVKKTHKTTIKKRKKATERWSGPTIEYYEIQLKFLENNNKKLLAELSEVKSILGLQEDEYKKAYNQSKTEFESKIEKLSNLCESLKKDKESMVIRYANSEKEVIICKKSLSEYEKKLKEAKQERECLNNRIKALLTDKARLSSAMDQKVSEFSCLQRDFEKSKEELSCKDIKIKWVQNKLKTEIEAHKETQGKLDHSLHRLQEMREEAEQVRKDCQEMIRHYQEAEEIKSVKLDHQLKQKLSELEVQRQERSDQEEVYQLLRQELEALKKKQRMTIEENNNLTLKIQSLERERLEYEQTLSKLKDNQNSLKQEVVDLTARLAEMENLSLHLEREKEKVSASVREVERLRLTNAELQSDMDACHMKEGELLEFTERLTAKTVHLQSEHSLLEAKAQTLEEDVVQLNKQCSDMEEKIMDLTNSLEEEKKLRHEETELLARKLAEKAKTIERLNVKLEEGDNENRVMKRRHITSIKELSRELHQCRKKLEHYEANCSGHMETASLGSRASSSASLDTLNNGVNQNAVVTSSVAAAQVPPPPPVVFSSGKSPSQNVPQVSSVDEVNKQMLIERIVKLQKALAKKNDKIEFLEDHIGQLVKEMKKKSKVIQNYILKTEPGALIPNSSDVNKLDLSKRGGIMASVYRSQLSDSNMTLDLSLEINNKLQAVLEDTLLKNITLKENINTLGEEIARLTSEKRELNCQITKSKGLKHCPL